jgi:hypothetical protein
LPVGAVATVVVKRLADQVVDYRAELTEERKLYQPAPL